MSVRYSQDAMYGGTGVTFVGWLLSQDWMLLLGALTSVLGLAVTWYFKMKEDQRKQRLYELEVRKITRELERDSCKGDADAQ